MLNVTSEQLDDNCSVLYGNITPILGDKLPVVLLQLMETRGVHWYKSLCLQKALVLNFHVVCICWSELFLELFKYEICLNNLPVFT